MAEDANDVLRREGAAGVVRLLETAKPRKKKSKATDDQSRPPARAVPKILLRHPEHLVTDEAVEALRDDVELYERAGSIVRVVHAGGSKRVDRPVGAGRIEAVNPATLRDRMSRVADFLQEAKRGGLVGAAPPMHAVLAVHSRGTWPLRHLEGIVDEPVLRPDGTILAEPGYDDATGLLLGEHRVEAVPDSPTIEEAVAAATELLKVTEDFPFAGEEHLSAYLAAVLTSFARFAFDGPAPMFVIEATTRGTGKSLLADVIAIIATGRRAARSTLPQGRQRDEELRKTITAVALSGDRVVLFDNITATIGGPVLDAALTATTWRDRLLGKNEMTADLPLRTVWLATANNATFADDTARRVLPIRLESDLENPEEREGFAHDDLRAHVAAERPRLAAAALTILRYAAGQPKPKLKTWGSFEAWGVVREAIVGLGLADPCLTREGIPASEDLESLHGFVHGLRQFLAADPATDLAGGWTTVAHLVDRLRRATDEPDRHPEITTFASGVEGLLRGARLSASALGQMLKRHRGRRVGGLMIVRDEGRNPVAKWRVV